MPRSKQARPGHHHLEAYNAKRDFEKTAEPPGVLAPLRRGKLRFVVQQHDARRMHYDFRLELDGVMKSWAVPKGPSLDPRDKRLAVETEDHPIGYNRFEGNIPQGQYGGGAVIVWDRGSWIPEGDAHEGLDKGHLSFGVQGQKMRGGYSMVRMGGNKRTGPGSNWLLLKRGDAFAVAGSQGQLAQTSPGSVLSGRTVEEVAAGVPRRRTSSRSTKPG